jgi:hypothetical protein
VRAASVSVVRTVSDVSGSASAEERAYFFTQRGLQGTASEMREATADAWGGLVSKTERKPRSCDGVSGERNEGIHRKRELAGEARMRENEPREV